MGEPREVLSMVIIGKVFPLSIKMFWTTVANNLAAIIFIVLVSCLGCSSNMHPNKLPSANIDTSKQVNLSSKTRTPKRVVVDTRGVALDTDGDGVPDYKDKERLTLSTCFPVDSSGVGLCPAPFCCQVEHWNIRIERGCDIGTIEIRFSPKSKLLTVSARQLLEKIAGKMKANLHCTLLIGTQPSAKKAAVALRW
jgi:OmpA-OmpF porin, OOP family